MKKIGKLITIFILMIVLFCSCFQQKLVTTRQSPHYTNAEYVKRFGVFNMNEKRKDVKYRISPVNAILGVVFWETGVVPIVMGGWFLWEPVEKK